MALTDIQVKNAKAAEKRYALSDGRGLLLEIYTSGTKSWLLRLWSGGKERRVYIGQYPAMGLREARAKAAEIRNSPDAFNAGRGGGIQAAAVTFSDVADEWFNTRMADKASVYQQETRRILDDCIIPRIGDIPPNDIKPNMILDMCRLVERRGAPTTAAKARRITGRIFRYAIATGRAEVDPTSALQGALMVHRGSHMAAITTPPEIGALIKNIMRYRSLIPRSALMFAAYTFCRPGEICRAEWSEIDTEAAEWRIPAEKMKMRRVHIVPLARQVLELLDGLRDITGRGRWVFCATRGRVSKRGHMGLQTMTFALRNLGYTPQEMTAHGFRAMASTRLNEMGWPPDVIERQLSHAENNSVRAAYNHAEYLDQRRKMMQEWADYLDALAAQN